jgi:hypothetical protein
MDIPESLVVGTHNNARDFRRRLQHYNATNRFDSPRDTVLFVEEKAQLQVLEVKLGPSSDPAATVDEVIAPYVERFGVSNNYRPTDEEVAAAAAEKRALEVSAIDALSP